MAVFNEILAGRFNRGLNKLFSMKGPAPSPQLASEIMPVLPLFFGNEARFLEGWQRYSMNARFPATAAVSSFLRFRNPKNSLAIAVIEQVSFSFPAAGFDEWVVRMDLVNSSDFPGALTAVGGANSQDNRGQFQPQLSITQQQAAPVTVPNFEDVRGIANSTVYMIQHRDDEITILPDQQLTFQSEVLNQQAIISARWRERGMEESEALSKVGG